MKADPREPDDSVNVTPTHWLREATMLTVGLAVVAVGVFTTIALLANLLAPIIPLFGFIPIFSRHGYCLCNCLCKCNRKEYSN